MSTVHTVATVKDRRRIVTVTLAKTLATYFTPSAPATSPLPSRQSRRRSRSPAGIHRVRNKLAAIDDRYPPAQ